MTKQLKPIRDADWYWQDGLAKFFPTSKGPTGTEREMFRYGFEEGTRLMDVAIESLLSIYELNLGDSMKRKIARAALNKINGPGADGAGSK